MDALKDPKILESELYAQSFDIKKSPSGRHWQIKSHDKTIKHCIVFIKIERLKEDKYLETLVLPKLKAAGFQVRR